MKLDVRWGILAAACGGMALALWLRRSGAAATAPASAELHEWENEGGNLAPATRGPDRDFAAARS